MLAFFEENDISVFLKPDLSFCLGDKFCADIECHDETLKSLSLTLVDNQKSISENTQALKGVTMESIGKVKESQLSSSTLRMSAGLVSISCTVIQFNPISDRALKRPRM